MRRYLPLAICLTLLTAGTSYAARYNSLSVGLRDVATIENGSGQTRVLFRCDPIDLPVADMLVRRASLRFELQSALTSRESQIRVFPITADWNPATVRWDSWQRPGGDFDIEVFGYKDVSYSTGTQSLVVDTTHLMKELLEYDQPVRGFLISVASNEGEGIDADDLSRFGALGEGRMVIEYCVAPPAPPGRR